MAKAEELDLPLLTIKVDYDSFPQWGATVSKVDLRA